MYLWPFLAAERRYNFSHGRKPVDGNFNDFPAPREMPIENHGLAPVASVVSPAPRLLKPNAKLQTFSQKDSFPRNPKICLTILDSRELRSIQLFLCLRPLRLR